MAADDLTHFFTDTYNNNSGTKIFLTYILQMLSNCFFFVKFSSTFHKGPLMENQTVNPMPQPQQNPQNGFQQQPQQAAPTIIIQNSQNVGGGGGMNNLPPNVKKIDKVTALLLCFFLGALGVHRFYEGKIGTGILYLCTLGLGGIGVLVDFIIILTKPNPYYVTR